MSKKINKKQAKKRCLFGWSGIELKKLNWKKQKGKRTRTMRKTKTKKKRTHQGGRGFFRI